MHIFDTLVSPSCRRVSETHVGVGGTGTPFEVETGYLELKPFWSILIKSRPKFLLHLPRGRVNPIPLPFFLPFVIYHSILGKEGEGG